MARRRSYHHGALREALVEAALEIVEEEGLEALTLRGVAARAKVSHAAPAHHFATLKALRTELARVAFVRFDAAMTDARAAAAKTPAAQLRAAGIGYLAFARANPGLFKLMFSDTLLDWSEPDFAAAANAAFAQLIEISGPAADAAGAKTDKERREIVKLIWASAHGYAHLVIESRMQYLEPEAAAGRYTPPDIAKVLLGK